jgi:threonyl-tRNA synthetase
MLILGDKELEEGTLSVRERKQGDIGAMTLSEFRDKIMAEKNSRSL